MVFSRGVAQCRSSTSCDTLKSMVLSGPKLNIGGWQDWLAIAVSGVHRAVVRREYLLEFGHLSPAMHSVIYDFGYAPFQKLLEFSAERGCSKLWSVASWGQSLTYLTQDASRGA